MEITPVAQGKYLLCNSVNDEPREFWDSNLVPISSSSTQEAGDGK